MSDIVDKADAWDAVAKAHDVYAAAREEYRKKIAEQAARIEKLEAALREIASHNDNPYFDAAARKITARTVAIARAALGENAVLEAQPASLMAAPIWDAAEPARAALEERT